MRSIRSIVSCALLLGGCWVNKDDIAQWEISETEIVDEDTALESSEDSALYTDTGSGDGTDTNLNSVDDDGDGYSEVQGDCDDGNNRVHPGAPEVAWDGVDQDCDGADLHDFNVVSVGVAHACGVATTGEIHCWGDNTYGQSSAPPGSYLDVAAGYFHTCALTSVGSLTCWGIDKAPETDPPSGTYTEVVSRGASGRFSCAVDTIGSPICWGESVSADGADNYPSVALHGLDAGGFVCGLDSDNYIECWGIYEDYRPSVERPTGVFTKVGVGDFHACAIDSGGSLACWGDDDYGQTAAPKGTFVDVDGGDLYTCAVEASGAVQCWGSYTGGPKTGSFVALSTNSNNGCGIRDDGTVECWGDDSSGVVSDVP